MIIPSFKLLFVYLMSENADWIHKNSHEDLDPLLPSIPDDIDVYVSGAESPQILGCIPPTVLERSLTTPRSFIGISYTTPLN